MIKFENNLTNTKIIYEWIHYFNKSTCFLLFHMMMILYNVYKRRKMRCLLLSYIIYFLYFSLSLVYHVSNYYFRVKCDRVSFNVTWLAYLYFILYTSNQQSSSRIFFYILFFFFFFFFFLIFLYTLVIWIDYLYLTCFILII
jgi:hypothetical protein